MVFLLQYLDWAFIHHNISSIIFVFLFGDCSDLLGVLDSSIIFHFSFGNHSLYLFRPDLISVLAQQLQSADILTSHRIFMILFRILKELSTKRLTSDQKNYAEVWTCCCFRLLSNVPTTDPPPPKPQTPSPSFLYFRAYHLWFFTIMNTCTYFWVSEGEI